MSAHQFPTFCPPDSEYSLLNGLATLRKGKTTSITFIDKLLLCQGSIWLETSDGIAIPEEKFVKLWVLFHAFLFEESRIIQHHDSGKADYEFADMYEDWPNTYDYQNILPRAYFVYVRDPSTLPVVSYDELFSKFISLDEVSLARVKNCLISLGRGTFTATSPIFNYSYWELIPSYSVIEGLIGRPGICSEEMACPKCQRRLQHDGLSGSKWVARRLKELVPNLSARKEYSAQIEVARYQIRNDTVHNSLFPTAERVDYQSGTHVYEPNRAVEEFKTDQTALLALTRNISQISRWLLMNNIFGLQVFPALKPLKVAVIKAS